MPCKKENRCQIDCPVKVRAHPRDISFRSRLGVEILFECECASLIRVKSHPANRTGTMATRPPRPKSRPSRRTRHSKDDSDIYAALNDFTDGIPIPPRIHVR